MEKYKDIPMDYADATLVSIAEDFSITHVVTFDATDFGIYRLSLKQPFVVLP
jgi:predicted nucleic acid-binding protein